MATALAKKRGGRVAFLDTESGSASKYSDLFDFDVVEVTDNYHPSRICDAIKAAESAGRASG